MTRSWLYGLWRHGQGRDCRTTRDDQEVLTYYLEERSNDILPRSQQLSLSHAQSVRKIRISLTARRRHRRERTRGVFEERIANSIPMIKVDANQLSMALLMITWHISKNGGVESASMASYDVKLTRSRRLILIYGSLVMIIIMPW